MSPDERVVAGVIDSASAPRHAAPRGRGRGNRRVVASLACGNRVVCGVVAAASLQPYVGVWRWQGSRRRSVGDAAERAPSGACANLS